MSPPPWESPSSSPCHSSVSSGTIERCRRRCAALVSSHTLPRWHAIETFCRASSCLHDHANVITTEISIRGSRGSHGSHNSHISHTAWHPSALMHQFVYRPCHSIQSVPLLFSRPYADMCAPLLIPQAKTTASIKRRRNNGDPDLSLAIEVTKSTSHQAPSRPPFTIHIPRTCCWLGRQGMVQLVHRR